MVHTSRIRWLTLALTLALAGLMLTVTPPPASAAKPDKGIETFMELMNDSGYAFATAVEAQDALTESGIPVDIAIALLEKKGPAAADYFVPLVIEVVELTESSAVIAPIEHLAPDELPAIPASTSCGSQETRVDLKGGASGWTVLWHQLFSAHCYNGSTIVGTPTATVTSGVTAYGLALGYKWTTTPSVESAHWVTYQTHYRINERGWYNVCPMQNPWYCFGGGDPWIRHDKYASGASIARSGL